MLSQLLCTVIGNPFNLFRPSYTGPVYPPVHHSLARLAFGVHTCSRSGIRWCMLGKQIPRDHLHYFPASAFQGPLVMVCRPHSSSLSISLEGQTKPIDCLMSLPNICWFITIWPTFFTICVLMEDAVTVAILHVPLRRPLYIATALADWFTLGDRLSSLRHSLILYCQLVLVARISLILLEGKTYFPASAMPRMFWKSWLPIENSFWCNVMRRGNKMKRDEKMKWDDERKWDVMRW